MVDIPFMMARLDTLINVQFLPMDDTETREDNDQNVIKIKIKHGLQHEHESTIVIPLSEVKETLNNFFDFKFFDLSP